MENPRLYLVSYDVRSPRRWRRVYRTLRALGVWTQYSVFLCRLPRCRFERLARDLAGLLDPDEDHLLIADLGEASAAGARLTTVGESRIPQAPRALLI